MSLGKYIFINPFNQRDFLFNLNVKFYEIITELVKFPYPKNVYIYKSITEDFNMAVEKLVTLEQFQKDPKLQAEFGGDYNKYLTSFVQKLNQVGIFGIDGIQNVPGLSKISLFFGLGRVGQTNAEQDKRFEAINKKLEQIKDPKIREKVAAEMFAGNLSDAFFDMIMERYDKKKAEFEEIWAKYEVAKGQAADLKKTCERLLAEYKKSEDDAGKKGEYNKAYNNFAEAQLDADIYLDVAGDVSHRVV